MLTIEQINSIKNNRTEGVVFTPEHVAKLMLDLIDVKEDDVLLDPCCGMGNLVAQSKTDNLVLIELLDYQHQALNELFTKDTHIIHHGSCFDYEPEQKINKAVINPPYGLKSPKEYDFVEYALNNMEKGGKCAVIFPVSCMLDKNKKQRSKLLQNHRLDAVITMPSEIFYIDAKHAASTSTVIAVFVAHEPQGDNKVYITEYDDGYSVQKHSGRLPSDSSVKLAETLISDISEKNEKRQKTTYRTIKIEDECTYDCFLDTEKPTAQDIYNKLKEYMMFEYNNREVKNDK